MEIPRESVRLMAESTGLELSDEVAALLAEDVCYRLREATQVSAWSRLALLSLLMPMLPLGLEGSKCRLKQVHRHPVLPVLHSGLGVLIPDSGSHPPEQLSVHEAYQAAEADGRGLQPGPPLEQCGGK